MIKRIPYDPQTFSHWHQLAVRFRDLDPLNHVNNAIFNTYFEESRIEYFRSIPVLLEDLKRDRSFVLVHISIDYFDTISYPASLTIGARFESAGNTSLRVGQACYDETTKVLKAVCESVLVWYDIVENKPVKLPDIPESELYRTTD